MALNPYLTLKLDGTDVRTVQANDDTKRYAVIFDGDSQTDDTWCIGTRLPDTQTEIQGVSSGHQRMRPPSVGSHPVTWRPRLRPRSRKGVWTG